MESVDPTKIQWLIATKREALKREPYVCAIMWCSCGGRRIGGCDCECHDVLEDSDDEKK